MKKTSLMSSWCKRKGALHYRELRSYPQVSKHILEMLIVRFCWCGFCFSHLHLIYKFGVVINWFLWCSCPGERWLKSLHPMGAMHSSLAVAAGTERHRLGESLGLVFLWQGAKHGDTHGSTVLWVWKEPQRLLGINDIYAFLYVYIYIWYIKSLWQWVFRPDLLVWYLLGPNFGGAVW